MNAITEWSLPATEMFFARQIRTMVIFCVHVDLVYEEQSVRWCLMEYLKRFRPDLGTEELRGCASPSISPGARR
jgi:hypothetical protein